MEMRKIKHACISCKKLLRLGPLIQKRLFHKGVETEDPVPNFWMQNCEQFKYISWNLKAQIKFNHPTFH